jgi:cell division protein FtsI (penicillin-binding protein 3)
VAQIVELSSNICASKIAESLGKDRFHSYLKSFGFGEKTEIDLPGESTGRLASSKKWGPVELATLSFGQGISVTAIQLASALSAIANGGYLIKPHTVKEIISPDGRVIQRNEPEIIGRVISYDTAETIKRILEGAVEKGTGKQASTPGYQVAGKTGTAQIPNPETRGYYSNRYLSSFIGFAPVDDPKITLVIVVENPKTSTYGGVVAAPIFRAITEKVLFYMGVPPQKGFVEAKIMPNLRGMSARDILRWAEKEGVKVKLTGSGYVNDQKPRAGERIKEGTVCSVELKQMI